MDNELDNLKKYFFDLLFLSSKEVKHFLLFNGTSTK